MYMFDYILNVIAIYFSFIECIFFKIIYLNIVHNFNLSKERSKDTAKPQQDIIEHLLLFVSQATGLKFFIPKVLKRNVDKFQTSFKETFHHI